MVFPVDRSQEFRALGKNRFVKLLLNNAHGGRNNDLCHWREELEHLRLCATKDQWLNEGPEFWNVFVGQVLEPLIQLCSVDILV